MTYFILFIVYDDCYVGCDIFMCTFIAYFVRNDEIKMFNQSINQSINTVPAEDLCFTFLGAVCVS